MHFGIPIRELQQRITSAEFVELWAFRNRNTLSPDVWFAAARGAAAQSGALPFSEVAPIVDRQAEAKRRARALAAEDALDRDEAVGRRL